MALISFRFIESMAIVLNFQHDRSPLDLQRSFGFFAV